MDFECATGHALFGEVLLVVVFCGMEGGGGGDFGGDGGVEFSADVVGGFAGSAIDNAYWFLPWTASFVGETAIFHQLTEFGVYFNVFFRQGLGIFAAYCHIRAAEMSSIKEVQIINRVMVAAYFIGISYVLLVSMATL